MTVTDEIESWRSVLESRGLDLEETEAPDGSGEPWFQALARFARRGFLRAILSPRDEQIAVHVQMALPDADDGYAETLKRHLKDVSGIGWEIDLDDRPWVLDVEALPEERLTDVIDVLELVCDHIGRAEAGEAPENLAAEFGNGDKTKEAESHPTAEPAENQAAADPADRNTQEEEDHRPAKQGSRGVFETIGADNGSTDQRGEGEKSPPRSDTRAPADDAVLEQFSVRVTDGTVRAELELVDTLGERAEKQLLSALARSLRARFDIKLLARSLTEKERKPVVKLAVEPATLGATSEASLDELSGELSQYFERLEKFNDMGLSLLDVLSPGAQSAPARRPSPRSESPDGEETRQPSRKQPRQEKEPRVRRRDDHRRAESEESGVVFSFGGADMNAAASEAIEAGNFTDSRVRREDATTPLVDVVLRHPGYSDKRMRQVLSILLDVDYFEAGKLTDQAPCVIAWGISQERAQEFKRVIERAGGRVTLVEPDSLTS